MEYKLYDVIEEYDRKILYFTNKAFKTSKCLDLNKDKFIQICFESKNFKKVNPELNEGILLLGINAYSINVGMPAEDVLGLFEMYDISYSDL